MRSLTSFAHDLSLEHRWLAMAEHAVLRGLMLTVGAALTLLGLGLGVTLVMLPVGVVLGLSGIAIVIGALDADLPLP
jgi:hypothetical protein